MASAQQMQAQVEQAQASLAEARVTGSAGGGLVRADVNGNGELVGIVIDPSVVDPADTETLADLVVAAVRDGMRAANELTRKQMSSVAGGLVGGLSLPGLDLPGLGAPGLDDASYEGDLEDDDDFDGFDDPDEDDGHEDDGDEADGDATAAGGDDPGRSPSVER